MLRVLGQHARYTVPHNKILEEEDMPDLAAAKSLGALAALGKHVETLATQATNPKQDPSHTASKLLAPPSLADLKLSPPIKIA